MLPSYYDKINLVLASLLYYSAFAYGAPPDPNTNIIIVPLNKTYTYANREIYGNPMILNKQSTLQVKFDNLPIDSDLTFFVIQVHSQFDSVLLYQNIINYENQLWGTNIGMISVLKGHPDEPSSIKDTFYIQNNNTDINIPIYLSVHAYTVKDPYPGGCNMEFKMNMSCYLIVETDKDVINVEAETASIGVDCIFTRSELSTFYMMYLPERSFDPVDYFAGIKKMMTLENILKYGKVIPQTSELEVKRTLSAYPEIGAIYVVVARNIESDDIIDKTMGYSVYVPNHSYGCPDLNKEGCHLPRDMFSQTLSMFLIFLGLFITFFGHRFFKTQMFLSGFFSGFLVTFILINMMKNNEIDISELIAASALSGVLFGATWLLFWWLYGIPVLAVLLPSLNLGFLFAAIFYYRLPANVLYLQYNVNFWTLFILLMLLTAMALVSVAYTASIVCCAVLGAFATICGWDYYMGSTLSYIVLNIVRRTIVPHFNLAVLSPPFQWRDLIMTLLWITLSSFGWYYQHWANLGRPPFPPPPRNTRRVAPGYEVRPAPGPTTYGALDTNITPSAPEQEPYGSWIRNTLSRSSVAFRNFWYRDGDTAPLLA